MVIPTGFEAFGDALRRGAEIYQSLRARLEAKVGDAEGLRVFRPGINIELAADGVVIVLVDVGYSEIETSEFRV